MLLAPLRILGSHLLVLLLCSSSSQPTLAPQSPQLDSLGEVLFLLHAKAAVPVCCCLAAPLPAAPAPARSSGCPSSLRLPMQGHAHASLREQSPRQSPQLRRECSKSSLLKQLARHPAAAAGAGAVPGAGVSAVAARDAEGEGIFTPPSLSAKALADEDNAVDSSDSEGVRLNGCCCCSCCSSS